MCPPKSIQLHMFNVKHIQTHTKCIINITLDFSVHSRAKQLYTKDTRFTDDSSLSYWLVTFETSTAHLEGFMCSIATIKNRLRFRNGKNWPL